MFKLINSTCLHITAMDYHWRTLKEIEFERFLSGKVDIVFVDYVACLCDGKS